MVIVIITLTPKKDCRTRANSNIFNFWRGKKLDKNFASSKIGSVRIRATSFEPKRC